MAWKVHYMVMHGVVILEMGRVGVGVDSLILIFFFFVEFLILLERRD